MEGGKVGGGRGQLTADNRALLSSPLPLYQNEVKYSAFDMEMIFHFDANKTHFHEKSCAFGLILKVKVFVTLVGSCQPVNGQHFN